MFKKAAFIVLVVSAFSVFFGGLVLGPQVNAMPFAPFFAVGGSNNCEAQPVTRDNCGILDRVVQAIQILSALVGVVVVLMIAIGGVQYALARDNPQAVAAAKSKIVNAILALVFYLMMISFLQWIVPGGVI